MRNSIKVLIFFIFILICAIGTVVYLSGVEDGEDIVYTSELLIKTPDKEYEVIVNNNDNLTIFRENDTEDVIYRLQRGGKARFYVPDFSRIESSNTIQGLKPYVNYSYNLHYENSYKYIRYLLDEGYSIDTYISTPQYLEIFLIKDGLYKRVVIFVDSIMVCDMVEGSEVPPIWKYLKSYNFNGYIEKKFNIDFEN